MGREEKLQFLLNALGNPFATPFLAEFFTPITLTKPPKGLLDEPITLDGKETYTIVERHKETGIVRAAFVASDNQYLRYAVEYEAPPRFSVSWDYSAAELYFLGLDERTPVGPYITQYGTMTHPYTGLSVNVYAIYFAPEPITAFYDGLIEAKIYNPLDTSINVWLVHFERWRAKDEYIALLRKYLES